MNDMQVTYISWLVRMFIVEETGYSGENMYTSIGSLSLFVSSLP